MGSKSKPPKAPKYQAQIDGVGDVIGALEYWVSDMQGYAAEQEQKLSGYADSIIGFQLPAMEEMFEAARADRQRYQETFVPLQDRFIEDAERYASPEEEARQRAKAGQDVANSFEAQREGMLRNLESYGIDPSQTRYQALGQQQRLGQAAASALAQNQAGERTQEIGRQLRGAAINMGAGLPAQAGQQAQLASGLGAGVLQAQGGTQTMGMQGKQALLPALGSQMQGYGMQADIKNTGYMNKMKEYEAKEAASGGLGGIGSLAGMAAGYYFGGPMGAQIGSQLGGAAGSAAAAEGGAIDAPGGPRDDAGLMALSDGEYVLPAEVVNNMGAQVLDKFVEKQTGVLPTRKQALPIPGQG